MIDPEEEVAAMSQCLAEIRQAVNEVVVGVRRLHERQQATDEPVTSTPIGSASDRGA